MVAPLMIPIALTDQQSQELPATLMGSDTYMYLLLHVHAQEPITRDMGS